MVQPLIASIPRPLRSEPGSEPPAEPPAAARSEQEPPDLAHFAANVREAVRRARLAEVGAIAPSAADVDQERGARVRRFFSRFTVCIARDDREPLRLTVPFRMARGPASDAQTAATLRAALGDSPAARHVGWIVAGRPSPEMLRDVAQALADRHPEQLGDAATFHEYLKQLGVGIDCAGSVQQALYASRGLLVLPEHGALGLRPRLLENLGALGTRGTFAPVASPSHARPGDVVTLKSPWPGEPGHTVIVAERRAREAAEADVSLGAMGFEVARGDRLVELDVDSSWGGVGPREHTWIYNERTGRWGDLARDADALAVRPSTCDGPYDHDLDGIFHARP